MRVELYSTLPLTSAQLKDRSYAEVLRVDFATSYYFPFDNRPGIVCRECVEVLGSERTVYLKGSLKPGPSLLSLRSISPLHQGSTQNIAATCCTAEDVWSAELIVLAM